MYIYLKVFTLINFVFFFTFSGLTFGARTERDTIHSTNYNTSALIQRQKIESSLTLLENKNNVIPLLRLDTLKIASISVGESLLTPFQTMLGNYTQVDHFAISQLQSKSGKQQLESALSHYNLVIVGIHTNNNAEIDTLISSLGKSKTIIQVWFTKIIDFQISPESTSALVMSYQNDTISQELAAQLIFGGVGAKGKLHSPIGKYPMGTGIVYDKPIRLKYSTPEEVGANSAKLTYRVDSILEDAISRQAFPGCNVLVAKDGKVILRKAYGFHTYSRLRPANVNDIYDLASVSKVSGGLPAIMKLYDDGKINLDDRFSTHYSDWKKRLFHPSNKEDITFRELLAHQAGLTPYIPLWKKTLKNGKLNPKLFRAELEPGYSLAVAPNLYLRDDFKKKVYKTIRLSPIKNRGKYVYSDLFFVLAPQWVGKISGIEFTTFLDHNFYRELGATTTTYNPFLKFPAERMVPTENDTYFRKRQLAGSVHDESAAVLGGISGNAGLFSSANDLAKLLQMYLQMGTYGGKQYLKESTLKEFTRVQYPENKNRRGLGFDKPLLGNDTLPFKDSYPAPCVSPESFGHSGYTGTFFWVDPRNQLVYILFTNRVFPTRENNKLSELNIRTKLQQIIYEEVGNIQ